MENFLEFPIFVRWNSKNPKIWKKIKFAKTIWIWKAAKMKFGGWLIKSNPNIKPSVSIQKCLNHIKKFDRQPIHMFYRTEKIIRKKKSSTGRFEPKDPCNTHQDDQFLGRTPIFWLRIISGWNFSPLSAFFTNRSQVFRCYLVQYH